MTWPEDRKVIDLEQKLSSIEFEFERWRDETDDRGPLPQHYSQVRRVTRQLGALGKDISDWLAQVKGDQDGLLRDSRKIEATILDVHKIWEFFRSKLAQRYVEPFKDYLVAADHLAWACYEPARKAADPTKIAPARVKEPPLVFLNGGWSPFAVSRGAQFEAEWVPDEAIRSADYQQILKDLPIPVIGMPWYQIRHVADMVVIGHEVGHNVEDDFGLTGRLTALLEVALTAAVVPEERGAGWRAWLGEIFADVYGILATGPAYVGCLMDFLALSRDEVMSERQPNPVWLPHPPSALRIGINLKTLELLGFDEANRLRAMWKERFPSHAMAAFDDDVEAVVKAILSGPYPEFGDKTLKEVISFGEAEIARAASAQSSLARGRVPAVDVRPMMAGARLAYEANPGKFVKDGAGDLVLQKIRTLGMGTVRVARSAAARRGASDQPTEDQDLALGHQLFERLRSMRGGSRDGGQRPTGP